jgi:hypothetical protein
MNPFELVERQNDKIQFASIERVIEMIYRDYKFITRIKVSDVLEWIGSIYGLINAPNMFRQKITGADILTPNITITQYRGVLPIDFIKVLKGGIRDYDSKEVYRESRATHTASRYDLNSDPAYQNTDKVYKIKGGYIFIEEEEKTLEMCYQAFPIDERGYPLVPAEQRVLEYAKEFISERIAFNLLAEKKIDPFIYDRINTSRMWRAGGAHTALIRPDPDIMESWTWARLKLTSIIGQHDSSYAYFGNVEDLTLGTNTD